MSKTNSFSKFISGKGFYVALAVCLVGAGSAAWVATNKTIKRIENQPIPSPVEEIIQIPKEESGTAIIETPQAPVAAQKTDTTQPKEQQKPSSSPQQQHSSLEKPEEQSKPQEPSALSKQSEKSPTVSFSLPINGEIICKYSEGELVKNETLGDWRTHNGIDIKSEKGADVMAAADGKITSVKNDAMWGMVVQVDCGNNYTIVYRGLAENKKLKPGSKVKCGEKIGTVGEIPCEAHLDCHIHVEIKHDGKFLNPLDLIKY